MKLPQFLKDAQRFVSRHSPEILTAVGISGMVTTVVLAVKATPKALQIIEEERENREDGEITKLDTVKLCWKCYIPATAVGVASAVCLVGANSVNAKRNAALATAYKLTETAFTEYKHKVVETIGEKKETAIKESIAKDHINNNPVGQNEVIILGKGTTLCYDLHSGRYFESDIDLIKRAVAELNRNMLLHDYVSLNDFYEEIGLSRSEQGDYLGWNISKGYIDVQYSSHLTEDNRPCLAISYDIAPYHGYDMYNS